ncbi:TenA family protein [Eisenibacter elegans]|jgi:thiaminase/transcriptional activator TenA|uniref:TenA family protein n=1 Tax=Eisenibacter elegans TaxID=997 RepID=UPI0004135CD7|nr:TenA family protein [Eisenibacter elegans]
MSWTKQAWAEIAPLYEKILALPFNQELQAGTLAPERFRFYIAQDAYYLGEFGRALSLISGRSQEVDHVLAFSRFATNAIVVERALHASYFQELSIAPVVQPSPSCQLYTQFLLNKSALDAVEVAVAAVLPCFWIYKDVGDHIYQHQSNPQNPYQAWIDTYAGEEFGAAVAQAIDIAEALAQEASPALQTRMLSAFVEATRMEWLFWHSAYVQEQWLV